MPSCAALLGKAEEEEDSSDHSEAAAVAPFEMATLKSKAFKQTKKERQEEMKDIDMGLEQDTKSKRRSSLRGKKWFDFQWDDMISEGVFFIISMPIHFYDIGSPKFSFIVVSHFLHKYLIQTLDLVALIIWIYNERRYFFIVYYWNWVHLFMEECKTTLFVFT